MYCKNCGKEIDDKAVICIYCGCATGNGTVNVSSEEKNNTPKGWVGFLFGFFFGILGLLGLLMYPDGTIARKTFIKGWLITFVVCTVLEIVFAILYFTVFAGMFASAVDSWNSGNGGWSY